MSKTDKAGEKLLPRQPGLRPRSVSRDVSDRRGNMRCLCDACDAAGIYGFHGFHSRVRRSAGYAGLYAVVAALCLGMGFVWRHTGTVGAKVRAQAHQFFGGPERRGLSPALAPRRPHGGAARATFAAYRRAACRTVRHCITRQGRCTTAISLFPAVFQNKVVM